MAKLVLIADDLTGAADSGIQFAKRGLSTVLLLEPGTHSDAEVIVLDTESRADSPTVARAKLRSMTLSISYTDFIYKKIDSTLRGNIGIELEAIMDARDLERVIVAPAFPATGRTTVNGQQLLDGQPLENTAFAQDPLSPITNSHIPTLLANQMRREVGSIDLKVVRKGATALGMAIRTREEAVLVIDATTESDLRTIVNASVQAGVAHFTCGSAGLADAFAEVILKRCVSPAAPLTSTVSTSDVPVLVVAASRNPLTSLQLSFATQETDLLVIPVDTERLAQDESSEIKRLIDFATKQRSNSRSVALSATDSPHVTGLSQTVVKALGQITLQLLSRHTWSGLVVTGGDAALAVCHSLRATALSLIGEVAPGIPLTQLREGPYAGLHLVTKAGGFGQEDAIAAAIYFIQGLSLQEARANPNQTRALSRNQ